MYCVPRKVFKVQRRLIQGNSKVWHLRHLIVYGVNIILTEKDLQFGLRGRERMEVTITASLT